MVLGDPAAWHPLDLPWDVEARPSLDEVIAVRRRRQAMVRNVTASLTPTQLDETVTATKPGWPLGNVELRQCLFIVVNEEWHHRLYAERDLDALELITTTGEN